MTNKNGLQTGALKAAPLDPEKTLDILRMRFRDKQPLKAIAEKYGHTAAGILHHVQRWKAWGEEQV